MDEGSAGFIMHVPQAAEVAQTRPVKEYFRCRAEDEELEKYAALVYSDLVRGGIHLMVVALILLVFATTCGKLEPVIPGMDAAAAGAGKSGGGQGPVGASPMVTQIAEILRKKREAEGGGAPSNAPPRNEANAKKDR